MVGVEGVGELVTGTMLARTVEPDTGDKSGQSGSACLNCGTPLEGEFCHACGQRGHVHRTLGAFWHDLVHSALHFDGKIWRTLPLLAWRPGELTRRYIEGERAKFVSPMALFLFSVFLMFAIFTLIGGPWASDQAPAAADIRAEAERDFRAEQERTAAQIAALRSERDRLSGADAERLDRRIAEMEAEAAMQARLFDQVMRADASTRQLAEASRAVAPSEDDMIVVTGADSLNAWFNQAFAKARENPSLLLYKIQTNAYKFSWAVIPISVPFVWLLFLHRRRYRRFRAYDHTVFVTYSIAFMSLGFIALSLLRPLGLPEAVSALAITFVPPWHMYRQLRGTYALSRFSALWRTAALLMFAFLAAGLFVTLLLIMGLLG